MKRLLLATVLGAVLLLLPVIAAGISSEPVLMLNTEMHTSSIGRIDSDAAGRIILTVSNDKTAKLWDAQTGVLLRTLRIPIGSGHEGILYAGAISPDGSIAVIGGLTKAGTIHTHIKFFDVSSGNLLHCISGLPNVISDLEFSPDGQHIAVALGGANGIRIWSSRDGFRTEQGINMAASHSDYGAASYNVAWDRNGRLASVSLDGRLRLYDPDFQLIQENSNLAGKQPISLAFSPDGKLLAVGYHDSARLQVFDGQTLQLLYEPDNSGAAELNQKLVIVSFSDDGKHLIAGGSLSKRQDGQWWFQIRVWQRSGRGEYADYPAGLNTIMDVKHLPNGSIIFAGAQPDWGRMSLNGRKVIYKQGEINCFRSPYQSHLRINNSGSKIGIKPLGKQALTFDVEQRGLTVAEFIAGKQYSDKRYQLTITDWDGNHSPRLNNRLLSFLEQNEFSYSVDISSEGKRIVFGTAWNVYCLDAQGEKLWETPTQAVAYCVNISYNGRVVIAGMGDGAVRWYRMTDGKLLMTLFLHPDNERWVLWTPEGYFDCSPGAEDLIGWHLNQGADKEAIFYPVSQFYEQFYTPNLGTRVLAGEVITQAEINISELKPAPVVRILLPQEGDREFKKHNNTLLTDRQTVEITVEVTDQGGGIDEILLYINGKLVETTTRGLSPVARRDEKQTKRFTVTLVDGVNIIRATAFSNQRVEAIASELLLTFAGEPLSRPDLYLFVIGINEYRNSRYNLNYAVADANAFKQIIEEGGQGLFNEINSVLLCDTDATKQRISQEFNRIKAMAKQEDVFIFYYAGHGVMSEEERAKFYLVPFDVTQLYGDNRMLANLALSADELRLISAGIRAQKQLYILDACQSGGLVETLAIRGAEEERAIAQLARSTGTYWITASGSEQFAAEFASLGHGLFTYSIIQGLLGKAGTTDDKRVTVQQLSSFLNNKVPELSQRYRGSPQYPNTYGFGQDFPIIMTK